MSTPLKRPQRINKQRIALSTKGKMAARVAAVDFSPALYSDNYVRTGARTIISFLFDVLDFSPNVFSRPRANRSAVLNHTSVFFFCFFFTLFFSICYRMMFGDFYLFFYFSSGLLFQCRSVSILYHFPRCQIKSHFQTCAWNTLMFFFFFIAYEPPTVFT